MFGACCAVEWVEPLKLDVGMPMMPANMLLVEAVKLTDNVAKQRVVRDPR